MTEIVAAYHREIDTSQGLDACERRWAWLSSGWLALAVMEATCILFVAVHGFAAVLGGGALLATRVATFHSAAIRLPVLALATFGALFNIWLLWNRWRLRAAPAARWRKQPLSRWERLRVSFILTMSLLTLLLVGSEMYVHHLMHGSAFAGRTSVSMDIRV